jgi:hypothetical protein
VRQSESQLQEVDAYLTQLEGIWQKNASHAHFSRDELLYSAHSDQASDGEL